MTDSLLYKLRMRSNLTQKQVADCLNVTQAEISRLEKGKRRLRMETLQKIASAFNLSMDQVVAMQMNSTNGLDSIKDNVKNPSGIPVIGQTTKDMRYSFKDKTPQSIAEYIPYQANHYFVKCLCNCMSPRINKNEYMLIQKNIGYTESDDIVVEFKEKDEQYICIGKLKSVNDKQINIIQYDKEHNCLFDKNNNKEFISLDKVVDIYVIVGILKNI